MLTFLERQSPSIMRLIEELEDRHQRLLVKCGRVISPDPETDVMMTNKLRGRIEELNLLIKELKAGPDEVPPDT